MKSLTLDDIEVGMLVNIEQLYDIMDTMIVISDLDENDIGKIVYIGMPATKKLCDLCEDLRKNNISYYCHHMRQEDWSEEDFSRRYKASSFAKKIGVSIEVLDSWNDSGRLKPEFVDEQGNGVYTESQYWEYARMRNSWYPVMLFGSDMDKLKEYAGEQGYEYEVFGKSFEVLVKEIAQNNVSGVIVSSRDSIPCNCFSVFEAICSATNTVIEFLDNSSCRNDVIDKIIKVLETYNNNMLEECYNKL